MPYEFLNLDVVLDRYPTLKTVLGEKWIEREQRTPMLDSAFPLARLLRIPELTSLVETLDRRLRELWNVPGASDWRDRLRRDGPGLRELQTELAFADLLLRSGFDFSHPTTGPDFSILLGSACSLMIEVTTPREVAWSDELTNRIWIISRMMDYAVRVEPISADCGILSEAISESRVSSIVSEALSILESNRGAEDQLIQSFPDLQLRITWTPTDEPFYSGRDAPNSSHFRAFNQIWQAAERKSKQLRKGRAKALLVGTNQMEPSDWLPYVSSIRNGTPYFGDFDWSQIHPQVDLLVFFEASYGDGRVPAVDYLVRPGSITESCLELQPLLDFLGQCRERYRLQESEDTKALMSRLMAREREKAEGSG